MISLQKSKAKKSLKTKRSGCLSDEFIKFIKVLFKKDKKIIFILFVTIGQNNRDKWS